jgi:hypothetical protein
VGLFDDKNVNAGLTMSEAREITMEDQRKDWNRQQKELRKALEGGKDHSRAIELFLNQHAMLHSSEFGRGKFYSFEDEILDELDDERFGRVRSNDEHSIAWCVWHMARIEDVTMNRLVAGRPQLFLAGGWQSRLGITAVHTGNVMDRQEVVDLSDEIDFTALRAYRLAVGELTREIVSDLQPMDLKKKVQKDRLRMIIDKGAVVPSSMGLIEYWGKRTIVGMLLMPPTRHNFIHLNEAAKLKSRR